MAYKTTDILQTQVDKFTKDLELHDIINELRVLFEEHEIESIARESTEALRTEKIVFMLVHKYPEKIILFGEILSINYSWLASELERVLQQNKSTLYQQDELDSFDEAALHIPQNRNLQIYRTDYLWQIHSYLKQMMRHWYLILYGKLGFGKKSLGRQACLNFLVMKSMGFKVYWLNLSKCQTEQNIIEEMINLQIMLKDSSDNGNLNNFDANKIKQLQQSLRKTLKQNEFNDCLLVLCDIQNEETLRAFDLHCKIMLTTQNKELINAIPRRSKQLAIHICNGFTKDESLELLARALAIPVNKLPATASALHNVCDGNPFVIAHVAKNLIELSGNPIERFNLWYEWLRNYEINDFDDRILTLISRTLCELNEDERRNFASLVIFTDNVYIRFSVLEKYWGESTKRVEETLVKFQKYSLVEIDYLPKHVPVISMHYIINWYLRNQSNPNDIINYHQRLVNSYKIPEALNDRTELDIAKLKDDHYFYYFIGHHLFEARMYELFAKLFLDFGFLAQKIRASGLTNTIGDLQAFRSDIIGNGPNAKQNEQFIDELIVFLPNVEETMRSSKDTCLLQCALWASGVLRDEALKQAVKYPKRLWLYDNFRSTNHRQIVPLPCKPKCVRFQDANSAVIALENSEIMLADLSPAYAVEPTLYVGHTVAVTQLEIFHETTLLSLDKIGKLKVWSLRDTPVDHRRSSTNEFNRCNNVRTQDHHRTDKANRSKGKCYQTIELNPAINDQLTCFRVPEAVAENQLSLLVGTQTGSIYSYIWTPDEHMFSQTANTMYTEIDHIMAIGCVKLPIIMAVDRSGDLFFYDFTDSYCYQYETPWTPVANFINLHEYGGDTVILVFEKSVFEIKFPPYFQNSNNISTVNECLYTLGDNAIVCSAISDNGHYLFLGTQNGIIVFDMISRKDIRHKSVSDTIACIDVVIDDYNILKYILITGSEHGHASANIYGLKLRSKQEQLVAASNGNGDRQDSPFSDDSHARHDWTNRLLGGTLFDVTEEDNDQSLTLNAINSYGRLHHQPLNENAMKNYAKHIIHEVTAVSANVYGTRNGEVYDRTNGQLLFQLRRGPVTFLKYFKSGNVVAGNTETYCMQQTGDWEFDGAIAECFELNEENILVVQWNCKLQILEKAKNLLSEIIIETNDELGACCLCEKVLMIGTKEGNLLSFQVQKSSTKVTITFRSLESEFPPITSLAISPDLATLAIGCSNGEIMLCSVSDLKNRITLDAHKREVNDLKFSPWHNPNLPLVLVSLSEHLSIWNVSCIQNNKSISEVSNRSISSRRFIEQNRMEIVQSDYENGNEIDNRLTSAERLWYGKLGADSRPELLACIKFVDGSTASKLFATSAFDCFVTIDSEGEIYCLRLEDNDVDEPEKKSLSTGI